MQLPQNNQNQQPQTAEDRLKVHQLTVSVQDMRDERHNGFLKFKIDMSNELRTTFNQLHYERSQYNTNYSELSNATLHAFLSSKGVLKRSRRRTRDDMEYYKLYNSLPNPLYSYPSNTGTRRLFDDSNSYLFTEPNAPQEFCEFAAQLMLMQLELYFGHGRVSASSELRLATVPPSEQSTRELLGEMNVSLPLILNVGGRTFQLAITGESADLSTMMKQLGEQYKSLYCAQAQAVRAAYEQEIFRLRDTIDELRESSFSDALRIVAQIGNHWRYQLVNNRVIVTYDTPIIPTRLFYHGKIYQIPDKYKDVFFVKHLEVDIKSINEYYVHSENAYHPNIGGSSRNVCIGDLAHRPVNEVLEKLPELLTTLGVDSGYPGSESRLRAAAIGNELEAAAKDKEQEEDKKPRKGREEPAVVGEQVWGEDTFVANEAGGTVRSQPVQHIRTTTTTA